MTLPRRPLTAQALTGCGWRAGRGWEHPRPTLRGGERRGPSRQRGGRGRGRPAGSCRARVPARGGAVTTGLPGQGGDRTSCRCIPPYPAPHLPPETAAVPLFRSRPLQGRGPPDLTPPPPRRPTASLLGGHNPLPSGLPPHLWLAGPGPPQAQAWPPSLQPGCTSWHQTARVRGAEAGRVDESLFLQSPREAEAVQAPTPEPCCPRGLPGPQ